MSGDTTDPGVYSDPTVKAIRAALREEAREASGASWNRAAVLFAGLALVASIAGPIVIYYGSLEALRVTVEALAKSVDANTAAIKATPRESDVRRLEDDIRFLRGFHVGGGD